MRRGYLQTHAEVSAALALREDAQQQRATAVGGARGGGGEFGLVASFGVSDPTPPLSPLMFGPAAAASNGPVTDDGRGAVVSEWFPLTPVQRWFFELPLEDPNHFNQCILLHGKEGRTWTSSDSPQPSNCSRRSIRPSATDSER